MLLQRRLIWLGNGYNCRNPRAMMKTYRSSLQIASLSYAVGIAAGLFLIVIAAWADMEATSYGFPRLANSGLNGLRCPILMTRSEVGTVSLTVSNTTPNKITPSVKALFSTSQHPEEFLESVALAPRTSTRLEWPVGSENIDLGNFILAKVLLYAAYPLPSQEATCGIFVMDMPGQGKIIVPLLILLSLLSISWGLRQIHHLSTSSPRTKKNLGSVRFLALVILVGLVVSFWGNWLLSVLAVVVSVLMIVILLGSLFMSDQRPI